MSVVVSRTQVRTTSQVLAGGQDGDARQVLAAKSLVQLSSQFATDQDLHHLVESLALTVAGQFAVPSVLAVFTNPDPRAERPILFAGGRFAESVSESLITCLLRSDRLMHGVERSCALESIPADDQSSRSKAELSKIGVSIVSPLFHQQKLIGWLGMGNKVSGKGYTADDLALLDLLINAVSPLVANAFMVAELVQLASSYRDILNGVRHGLVVVGPDERIRNANDEALRLLREVGATEAERPSQLEGEAVATVFPDTVFPGWLKQLLTYELAATGGPRSILTTRVKGEDRLFSVSAGLLPAFGAQESCILITFQDVTVQKQSEQRLFELEKFAERGMMASEIAHELNNFIGMILGGSELAGVFLQRSQFDRAETALLKVRDSALKMERFTAGLMDYSRMKTTKQPGSLNAIIGDVISFLSLQKRFSLITVESRLLLEVGEFDMDKDQIAQLLINMLNNAADAILDAKRGDGRIEVRTERQGEQVRLSVTDNGCGMTEDVKARLFNTRLTTKPTGHGYGLMVCEKIITNHYGVVEIDSALGRGSTITIRFDLSKRVPDEQ